MELTSNQIYHAMMHGAHSVIKNKETLNLINVFPVRDGDTGSNLASMMRSILQLSRFETSVKATLESISDAAILGARGNSGIIFAQYFSGLSQAVEDVESISLEAYIAASNQAALFAYHAIENPVEGTMITLMKAWAIALKEESRFKKNILDVFSGAFSKIEDALEKTKQQLEALRKANVVDSGAKGFTYFIEGSLYYIKTGKALDFEKEYDDEPDVIEHLSHDEQNTLEQYRYCTECLLENPLEEQELIKKYLSGMGNSLVMASNHHKLRIHIHTDHPEQVFDHLYDKGAIIFQKVDDMKKQQAMMNRRRASVALITDSIADLPEAWTELHQVHIVNLDILFKDRMYMDKLTIKPERLLELSEEFHVHPTSSQPSPKRIENLYDYLSTYYTEAIVLTVSKELSGTFNNFDQVSKKYKHEAFDITVINTRQNSVAQGLLVKKCAELIESGVSTGQIVKQMERMISDTKILVQVKNLDSMIRSGRLSVRTGKIGKKIGMKPIITLDNDGKGALDAIAFSEKGSNKKILQHLKKILKHRTIERYAIIHVGNLKGAQELAQSVTPLIGFAPEYIDETSSIIAISAGFGAVAIGYMLKEGGR